MSDFAQHVASFADKYHRTHGYLPSGPKGPDNTGEPPGDDMLPRIERLEDDMKDVKASLKAIDDRLRGVETRAAEISGKISNLPGWPGLLVIAGVIIGSVGLMLRFMPPG